jgi:hypothetical protein
MRSLLSLSLVFLMVSLAVLFVPVLSVQVSEPALNATMLQTVTPAITGAGGLLSPEPIETGAPNVKPPLEDVNFWVIAVTLALLAVLGLMGILRSYQRTNPRRR